MENSLFEPKEENKGYGFFGYEASMTDFSIAQDDAKKVQECIDRGWIVPETRTLDNRSLVWHARRNGKMNAAKVLLKNGWSDEPTCPVGAGRFY